jgi:hypothetical protein
MAKIAEEFVEFVEGTNRRFIVFSIVAEGIEGFITRHPDSGGRLVGAYLSFYRWIARLVSPLLRPGPGPFLGRRLWQLLLIGWAAGFALSFGANAIGAYISGTWGPDNPTSHVLSFTGDEKNLKIYLLWAPWYVALSLAIMAYALAYWRHFRFFANHLSHREGPELSLMHVPASLYLATAIGLLATYLDYRSHVTAVYGADPLPRLYWYLREIAPGQYELNAAGYLHFGSNFIKLWILAGAVLAYIAISIELIRCVHAVHHTVTLDERDKRIYVWCVKRGDYFFLLTVWLFIVIVLHNMTWTSSASGDIGLNKLIAQIVIMMAFVFVIEIPRHYVKYRYVNGSAEYQAIHRAAKKSPNVRRINLIILVSKALMYFAFIEIFLDHTLKLHINESAGKLALWLSQRAIKLLEHLT